MAVYWNIILTHCDTVNYGIVSKAVVLIKHGGTANGCCTHSRWQGWVTVVVVKCMGDDVENRNYLVQKRCLALRHLLCSDEKNLRHNNIRTLYIAKLEHKIITSSIGKSFSSSSHSCFVSWNRLRRAEHGLLCCSKLTSKFSASQSRIARSISSAVLFQRVATSHTIRRGLVLVRTQAILRSAQIVGLLKIRLARLRSCQDGTTLE